MEDSNENNGKSLWDCEKTAAWCDCECTRKMTKSSSDYMSFSIKLLYINVHFIFESDFRDLGRLELGGICRILS